MTCPCHSPRLALFSYLLSRFKYCRCLRIHKPKQNLAPVPRPTCDMKRPAARPAVSPDPGSSAVWPTCSSTSCCFVVGLHKRIPTERTATSLEWQSSVWNLAGFLSSPYRAAAACAWSTLDSVTVLQPFGHAPAWPPRAPALPWGAKRREGSRPACGCAASSPHSAGFTSCSWQQDGEWRQRVLIC